MLQVIWHFTTPPQQMIFYNHTQICYGINKVIKCSTIWEEFIHRKDMNTELFSDDTGVFVMRNH